MARQHGHPTATPSLLTGTATSTSCARTGPPRRISLRTASWSRCPIGGRRLRGSRRRGRRAPSSAVGGPSACGGRPAPTTFTPGEGMTWFASAKDRTLCLARAAPIRFAAARARTCWVAGQGQTVFSARRGGTSSMAAPARISSPAAAAEILRGEVRGPDDAVGAREVGDDLSPPPDVVSERDHVGPGPQQLVRDLWRDAETVGRVLAVDDAEVYVELLSQPGQPLLDRAPPWGPVHVSDEEKLQGIARVAAGWTSAETWFPASCV